MVSFGYMPSSFSLSAILPVVLDMTLSHDEKCTCLGCQRGSYVVKQPFGYLLSASFPAQSSGWACLLLLFVVGSLRASELPAAVTLDLPIPANQATPSWLGHPETPPTTFATLNLPVLAPDANASLLVTVYFQEKQGGFMRVIWKEPRARNFSLIIFTKTSEWPTSAACSFPRPRSTAMDPDLSMRRLHPGHPTDQIGMARE